MTSARTAERVTIIDVAKEANVSFATVSRVVTGKGYVSSATRERVVDAMARTGYVVNREARALAGGRHQVIGLLVPDLDTSYGWEILRGIDEELASASYDLMLYTTHRRKTRESEFVHSLTQGSTDGLLMILPMDPGAYVDSIRRRDFPYVIIDHTGVDEQGPSVGATNRLGAIDAVNYLLSLGHRRIGFITGIPEMGCAQERLVGYQEALQQAGIPYDASLVRRGQLPPASGLRMHATAPGAARSSDRDLRRQRYLRLRGHGRGARRRSAHSRPHLRRRLRRHSE